MTKANIADFKQRLHGLGLNFARANYLTHIHDKRKVAYIETPKVACTSIKKFMMDDYVHGTFPLEDPNKVHDREISPLQRFSKLTLSSGEEVLFGDEYRRFSFVRNPFSRLLSGYLDKLVNNEYERNRHLPLMGFEQGSHPTLLEFLERLAQKNDAERDIHFATQTALLMIGNVKYDYIGHFETFQRDFRLARAKFFGAEHTTETYEKFGKHHASNANEKILSFYGPREIELVREIYSIDFKTFSYPFDIDFANLHGRRSQRPLVRGDHYAMGFAPLTSKPAGKNDSESFDAAWGQLLRKNFSAARDAFSDVARQREIGALAHRAFDAACFCQMKNGDAEETYDAFFAQPLANEFGETLVPVAQAAHAIYEDDWNQYWKLASTLPTFDPAWFGPWNRGLLTRPEQESSTAINALAAKGAADIDCGAVRQSASPILLMAANSVYMQRHAACAIESYREIGGEEEICLVILNPTAGARQEAAALQARFSGVHVRYQENVPKRKAYFTSARYIMAAEIMREFARPVFVFDIGVAFSQAIPSFFAKHKLSLDKIGLRISPRYTYPWQKITVNALYLPFNLAGMTFARHMQLFLKLHFSVPNDDDIWWIDQNAALSAYSQVDPSVTQNLPVKGFISFPKLEEA